MSRGIAKAMADVFISYAREDRPKVQLLAEAFEGRGWSVWWDTRLKAGEVWDDVIERELNATRCVVVLWSKASVQKHWVRVEAGEGLERRILVPAFIEDVRPPLAFRLLQAEHLIDWSGDSLHPGLNRLLAAVSERLRAQNLEEINRQPAAEHDLAVFRDVDALWCPEMVALPAGEFLMGSPKNEEERFSNESPQHRVTIRDRFAIGQYPITVGEYRRFVEATAHSHVGGLWDGSSWKVEASKSWRDPGFLQTDRHPVVGVSWWDAQAYIEWLARETGKPYRLPSEAEWEYACRAETKTRYSFGNRIMPKDANYGESNLGKTTEAGSFPPNAWGLYDMHGNVWEWVEDVWHDSYEGAPTDGAAWTDGEGKKSSCYRVNRGGSWNYFPKGLRSANRNRNHPDGRFTYVGFRVARTLD